MKGSDCGRWEGPGKNWQAREWCGGLNPRPAKEKGNLLRPEIKEGGHWMANSGLASLPHSDKPRKSVRREIRARATAPYIGGGVSEQAVGPKSGPQMGSLPQLWLREGRHRENVPARRTIPELAQHVPSRISSCKATR